MNKKKIQLLYKELVDNLTDKQFLKKIKLSKKSMLEIIALEDWKENIGSALLDNEIDCKEVLSICQRTMENISVEPRTGWLDYIYNYTLSRLFPDNPTTKVIVPAEAGRLFYLEVLRTFLKNEKATRVFEPTKHFELLSEEDCDLFTAGDEYKKLMKIVRDDYIYEFMRIGSEISGYNTLGHISGVHFVSMHVAKQLYKINVPVDLALVSGAAAGHDIGKYGCKPHEAERIPYLHYYYTDKYFKNNDMPSIGHIATNHSTWDLELENLSVESLILIYADFRVKSNRNANGDEVVNFYSLKDSFDVILNKLDNVDQAKKDRYIRVYSKLKDFEDYMEGIGVNTNLDSSEMGNPIFKDPSLMNSEEVVYTLKNLAISHNINLMHKLNDDISFCDIIEAARSEKNWKNIRAYMNIFKEYFTYITQKQKLLTLNFLYELLMHREGDIRRQAADLLGNIIVNYDEEYRKEMPIDATREEGEINSLELFSKYLESIILPDHKVTDQHRRWIGYTLKLVVGSVLERCKEEERSKYLNELLLYYDDYNKDDSTAFILLDSMLRIPLVMCNDDEILKLINFAFNMLNRESLEIKIAALRFIKYISEEISDKQHNYEMVSDKIIKFIDSLESSDVVGIEYLRHKIINNCYLLCGRKDYEICFFNDAEANSEIFLENLKAATPWVIKDVNIELLLDQIEQGYNTHVLHVATHFSNLIKVSERVAVRHSAGAALLEVTKKLSLDQRNEVVIELTKGLEIGEYEFSKYIPEYLGQLALFLHPNELDEFVSDLKKLLESKNERVASVTLNTLGIMIQHYHDYKERFPEEYSIYNNRREVILGMILRGLANYNETINQEALLVFGQYIFGSKNLSFQEKYEVFQIIYKKLLTLFSDQNENELSFYNSAASLNHIYRFISDYIFYYGKFEIKEREKVAFFPGTFDPFSLSHKGIVDEIKNLGFDVFLALDEFSWSKKTQPRMIRRKIISMSVANDRNVYLFPDDIPVNIANPEDMIRLSKIFDDKEVYMVVGSDVVDNASCYKALPQEGSIHYFNHVIFKRETINEEATSPSVYSENDEIINNKRREYKEIRGEIVELTLPIYLEDISSTRIRENIDYNRDISNLIDPVAQNYIYDNSLYLREPQYKHILKAKAISFEIVDKIDNNLIEEMNATVFSCKTNILQLRQYLKKKGVSAVIIRDGEKNNELVGVSTFHKVSMSELFEEFESLEIAEYIRRNTSGKIIVLSGILAVKNTDILRVEQIALTETLAYCLKEDYTFALFHDYLGSPERKVHDVLERQGFLKIAESALDNPIFYVDMRLPVSLFQNVETVIKEPFNRSEKVLKVIEEANQKLQMSITKLYPGNLVLSFNAGVMHYRLVDKITKENNVPSEPLPVRTLGKFMCVPFGKILRGIAVPNTVTKALHTEKVFSPDLLKFNIQEFPYYSPLINQIRTINSFNRPVILVDDLLHKGYRIKKLDPLFKQENVNISKIIVGILSGRGKDLMDIQGRKVDSVYFIPNLRSWFVESSIYPFIGGDSVDRKENLNASLLSSINLTLPYVGPTFLVDAPKEALYEFSMTCLENSRNILMALEDEYQVIYERNLTLNRLSEAIIAPRCPDKGVHMSYDPNLAPSVYIANDIEKMIRLKNVFI